MNSKLIRQEKGHYRLNYAIAQPIFDSLKRGLTLEQAGATVKIRAATVNRWLVLGERCPEEDAATTMEAPDRVYRQFTEGVHSAVAESLKLVNDHIFNKAEKNLNAAIKAREILLEVDRNYVEMAFADMTTAQKVTEALRNPILGPEFRRQVFAGEAKRLGEKTPALQKLFPVATEVVGDSDEP